MLVYFTDMRLVTSLLVLPLCLAATASDITGPWELTLTGGEIVDSNRVKIARKDGQFVFEASGSTFLGTLTGNAIEFRCQEGKHDCGLLKGTLDGAIMSGDGSLEGIPMKWTARRPAVRPASPTRHDFVPTAFYRQFSSAKAAGAPHRTRRYRSYLDRGCGRPRPGRQTSRVRRQSPDRAVLYRGARCPATLW